jgi:hypothetical protein
VDLSIKNLEVEAQDLETFSLVNRIFDKTRWIEVGVEIDGQQILHLYALPERMPKYNVYFAFARQKGSKIGNLGVRSRL